MKRIIRKKFRKFWKSVINRRLVKYASRFSLAVFMLVVIFGFGKIQGTNSFFMDTATVAGNEIGAGWWVPPTISISSPAGGEEWQVGSSHNIMWTADSADPAATASMSIDIDYSCDGDPWQMIIHNTTNDGTQSWTVPADVSDNCRVKVTATDSHGLTNSAESNEFEISWMVVLNEFLPKPATGNEWVEIYNNGSVSVDVNGWKIKDELNQSRVINSSHTNTGSTVINPASSRFLVVQNYDSFYLNDDGDTIKLYDASDNLLDLHTYAAGDVSVGKTIARSPDGVGGWVDPVPTPGEKNDPSNDKKDFQKYYRKVCFDENDKPRCDLKFLRSIGLLDEKSEVVGPAEAEEIVENNPAENGESENSIDQGGSGQEEVAPVDEVVADPAVEDDESGAEAEEPQIITKEFDIKLSGKLDVPEGFEAEVSQKMRKIELSGKESVLNDLKDFEIDLAKIEIKKEESKIEILVSDLDLPKGVELTNTKKDDVVVLITVSEKPKEEPKDDAKKDDNKDEKLKDEGSAILDGKSGNPKDDGEDSDKDKDKDKGDDSQGKGGENNTDNSNNESK